MIPKYLFHRKLSLFCLGTNFELSDCKVSKAETLEPPESPTQYLHPPPSHTQITHTLVNKHCWPTERLVIWLKADVTAWDWVFVPHRPTPIHMLRHNPLEDGIRMKASSTQVGLVPLKKRPRRNPSSLPPCEDSDKTARSKRGSSRNTESAHTWPWISASRTVRNKFLVFRSFQIYFFFFFVTAAQKD